MDKLVKLAVVLGALLAGVGLFYHYVVFLPALEREKVAAAEQEKQSAAARETQRQQTYEGCVALADLNYSASWATACKAVAQSRTAEYKNCLTDKLVMGNQFMGAQYCKNTYGESDSSADCTLPGGRANSINSSRKQEQEKCVTEARLGLK